MPWGPIIRIIEREGKGSAADCVTIGACATLSPVSTVAEERAEATPRARRPSHGAAALLAYSAIGIVRYWPVLRDLNGRVAAPGGDTAQYVFGFGWIAHLLTSPANPFHVDYLNHPAGANLLNSTTVPFLGFVFSPITLLVGPIASYNLSLVVGFAVSGFATYLLVARWVESRPIAFAAAAIVPRLASSRINGSSIGFNFSAFCLASRKSSSSTAAPSSASTFALSR